MLENESIYENITKLIKLTKIMGLSNASVESTISTFFLYQKQIPQSLN